MPRTPSAGIQAQIALGASRTNHLLALGPVNGTTYYFGEDNLVNGGHTYLPYLRLPSGIKFTQKLQLDPVAVQLDGVDLSTIAIINTQKADMQGATAKIYRFWPEINESLLLAQMIVTEVDVDQQAVLLTLSGDLDPTASQVPARTYQPTCNWDFKSADCGYTDGVSPDDPATSQPFLICGKDFLSCTARSNGTIPTIAAFPGFINISRDLTLLIEGNAPDANPAPNALAALQNPWEQM